MAFRIRGRHGVQHALAGGTLLSFLIAAAMGGGSNGGAPQLTPTHYVYNGSTPGDGSVGSPWTVAQYRSNVAPGNVVQFQPGTYTLTAMSTSGDEKWRSPLQPDVSGTAVNPIVVQAAYRAALLADDDPNRTVIVMTGATATGALACLNRSYVEFDGFFVDERDFTSPRVSDGNVAGFHTGTNCKLRYNRIIAASAIGGGTNHAAMRLEETTGCELADNRVESQGTYSEENGILVYASRSFEIHHNRVVGGRSGIRLKGDKAGLLENPAAIHHNHISGAVGPGLNFQGIKDSGANDDYCDAYQNLVVGCGYGVEYRQYDIISPTHVRLVNNTITGSGGNILVVGTDTTVNNELFAGCAWRNNVFENTGTTTRLVTNDSGLAVNAAAFARLSSDRNCFSGLATASGTFVQYTMDGTYTYAQWLAAGRDNASLTGSPGFIGGGSYKLDAGSQCLAAGTDFLNLLGGGTSAAINMGCYILPDQSDTIGVRQAA